MSTIDTAVRRLVTAAAEHQPCPPVRDLLPTGDLDAAYAVQTAVIAGRLADGAAAVGRKIGLTNPRVQAQLGVDRPDFGVLLDDMACAQTDPVDIGRLLQPRIEAEIAFVLAADINGVGDITPDVVRAAVDYAVPALEIVDSRIDGWDISIVDTIADNGSSGLFVLGEKRTRLEHFDPISVRMTMTRAGQDVSAGTGADCLGDPLLALAWLATEARDRGAPLRRGDVVLSGALGPMVAVGPGDEFLADLSELGTVRATFTDKPQEMS